MIELKHICKSFGSQTVLDDISCEIGEGQVWCIIGQSGGGKSVMLKIMTGLLGPDQGEVLFDGQSTLGFTEREWSGILQDVGVVFQGAALFSSLSVYENVGIRLIESGQMDDKSILERVSAALDSVGLNPSEVLNKFPGELSGGMQKRVGVARAIVHRPKWLFYDEPTTGLDPVSSGKIDELISNLALEKGRTSIIITHDMYMVKTIATKVLLLHDHKVRFLGSPKELFLSEDEAVKQFLARKF